MPSHPAAATADVDAAAAELQFKGAISHCFEPFMDCYVQLERNNIKELIDEVERSEVKFLLVGVGVSTTWCAGLDLHFGVVHQQIQRQR